MEKIDLKRLATELNLSIATVSKALRDSWEIKAETKQRVRDLADKLNYQPNPYASSLRKRKSQSIAVVIPEIANNFFSVVLDGIQVVAEKKGYHVLTYLTHENYQNELSTIKHLQSGRVDGVIMSICSETPDVQHLVRLKESGMPMVFFDRVTDIPDCPTVTTDDYESSYKATEHLIQKGCRTIAYLSLSKFTSVNQKRKQGYMDALLGNKIKVESRLIIQCENDNEKNQTIIRKLLSSKKRPDGIFASVEKLAIATYYVCNEMKIAMPGELKLISFSNLRTASLLNPSLSTITQPAFEIGKEACELLFMKINKKSYLTQKGHLIIKSSLIERESTGSR
jgi:LacI family transcriptional regulator